MAENERRFWKNGRFPHLLGAQMLWLKLWSALKRPSWNLHFLISFENKLRQYHCDLRWASKRDLMCLFSPLGKSPIEKLNDGSCNHIRCAICTCEFCWLCMKEVDNLHFITPTGCTFYGKKRWSKQKSIIFLILSWILTPILALLFIVIAIPLLLIILPIMITKKFYQYTLETEIDSIRRYVLCIFVFLCAFLLTPFLLILALLIGVPLLLFFIYFYMPKRYIAANF